MQKKAIFFQLYSILYIFFKLWNSILNFEFLSSKYENKCLQTLWQLSGIPIKVEKISNKNNIKIEQTAEKLSHQPNRSASWNTLYIKTF